MTLIRIFSRTDDIDTEMYISSIKIIGNNLYILYTYNNVYYLININMINKNNSTKIIFNDIYNNIYNENNCKIIGNHIYLSGKSVTRFNFDGEFIDTYEINSNYDTKVVEINNKPYYLVNENNNSYRLFINEDYGYSNDTNSINIIFRNKLPSGYINNILYLNIDNNINISDIQINSSNNWLIFYIKANERVIMYNMITKNIKNFMSVKFLISDDKFIHSVNNAYKIYNIKDDKNYELPNEFLDDMNNEYLEIYTFNYKNQIYYIKYNFIELLIYRDINNNVISNGKKILIGTKEKQYEMSVNLLSNSEYLNNLFTDLNIIPEKLIHESFENIGLYKDYIEHNKFDNLYELFKISNFLMDKNLDVISDKIIEYIKYDDVNIDISFMYLELMITSYDNNKISILFYNIIKKYEPVDIINKFNQLDKNSILYEFIANESLTQLIVIVQNK